MQESNTSIVIELEAEDSPREKIWYQNVPSGVWEKGQVHVKAGFLFANKAYQVITAPVFCALVMVCNRRPRRCIHNL